jgi:glucosamine--fructose-6-phosphate aminotransferase (isomerizing)
MCGIVAYIGKQEAYPIIIKGLQRLEYRGYDSAGVALLNGDLNVYKKAGKVSDLAEFRKRKKSRRPCRNGSYPLGYAR